ncbi:MAG: hypothetical protein AB1499_01370 [Nitrospirota bacterium]
MKRKYIISLALFGLLFIIIGCGGGGVEGGSEEAPAEATITITPPSGSYVGGDETTTVGAFVHKFTIVVKDANGIPLRNVDLTIFYPFAVPGSNVVQFYDGDPSQGAPAQDSPMTVTTDGNGSYTLFMVFLANGNQEYSADLQVNSGAVYGSATFEVTVE